MSELQYRSTVGDFFRFFEKVSIVESGCWEWNASRTHQGYGRFGLGGKRGGMKQAHRVSYEWLSGPIPKGLCIDHLCRNTRCVNPKHLEVVTNRENLLRGEGFPARYAKATHCKNGHEFTPENTYIRLHRGGRYCRKCGALHHARKKAARSGSV